MQSTALALDNAPVLAALRTATGEAHRRLEARHALSVPFASADYEAVLRASYGYYAPLERRLEPFAASVPELDWHTRRKVPLLQCDLVRLGTDPASIPQCTQLPGIACMADALGCLYVLEGATLGGQVLLKRVRARLDLDVASGAAFYAGYGEHTSAMWKRFIDCLRLLQSPADRARACASAQSTFQTFELWLEVRGALRTHEEMHG